MLKDWHNTALQTRVLVGIAMGIALVLTLLHVCCSKDMYRDSGSVYSFMARALAQGDLAGAFHPSIPSLNVLLSGIFSACGLRPEQAISLVSGLFYVATIPFLYLLLKEFLPQLLAAVGALLFTLTPKISRFSCTGLIDSGKIFFLVAALYFACILMRKEFRSYKIALAFGAALGGLSLARSEGIGNALVLAGCVGAVWLYRSWRNRKMEPLLPCCAGLAVWILLIFSRMWLMWRFCGEFIFDRRIANLFHAIFAPAPAAAANAAPDASAAVGIAERLLAVWNFLNQNIRGSYEVYWGTAMLGLVLVVLAAWTGKKWGVLWADHREAEYWYWRPFYWILLIMMFCNMLIFKMSGVAAYRYFLVNVPLLMVFTLIGGYWLWLWVIRLLSRWGGGVVLLGLAGLLVLQLRNGTEHMFSKNAYAQYRTGRLVGEIVREKNPDGKIWFQRAGAEWYYSETARAVPVEGGHRDPKKFQDFDYVLWQKKEEGEKELANRRDLREISLPDECTARLYEKVK